MVGFFRLGRYISILDFGFGDLSILLPNRPFRDAPFMGTSISMAYFFLQKKKAISSGVKFLGKAEANDRLWFLFP